MRLPSSIIFDSIQPSKEYLKVSDLEIAFCYDKLKTFVSVGIN